MFCPLCQGFAMPTLLLLLLLPTCTTASSVVESFCFYFFFMDRERASARVLHTGTHGKRVWVVPQAMN